MPAKRCRIAAILPLESEYSSRLLEGALKFVRERKSVTLVDMFYPVDTPGRLRLRSPLDFDAAMIWASRDAGWVEDLLERRLPMIAVSGEWPVERLPCIAFDSQAVIEGAVEHLAATGPAALLHVEFRIRGLPSNEGRARRFREAGERHGIATSSLEVFSSNDRNDSEFARRAPLQGKAARRLKEALAASPKPLAVWCGEDHLPRRVCEAAEELGLRVPEDVAVLGAGNFQVAECGLPQLSSQPFPGEVIGFQAFSTLHRMVTGAFVPPPYTPVLPPPVVGRESTLGNLTTDAAGRAKALIARRSCESITVRQVADGVGLSPQTLHARFLKRYGRSPGEEIRHTRLAAAKRFLQDPSVTISRVAGLCGFDQPNRFSNFFRRETGLSPRAWRQVNGSKLPN